jgi:hypothetical protein
VSYQWYHSGLPISGATDYFYVATEGGDFNVVATDANGCEVEAVINDVIASINVDSHDKRISVFPNPAGDQIIVSGFGISETGAGISILNMLGQPVKLPTINSLSTTAGITSCSINVSSLPPSVYYIELAGNGQVFRIKFIKK